MKILIAYAGKSGTTEKCAKLLAEKITGELVDVVDLCINTPNAKEYDTVVIGSNIHMGAIHKKARKFMQDHESSLIETRTAYFFCCGFADKKDEIIAMNYPGKYKNNAIAIECFGGEMDMNQLHGMDKFIAKLVTRATANQGIPAPSIKLDRIEALAQVIKSK